MDLKFEVMRRQGKFYVVSPCRNWELAPVFDEKVTAQEICGKVNKREKYFNNIPLVPFLTPYPRPVELQGQVDPYTLLMAKARK